MATKNFTAVFLPSGTAGGSAALTAATVSFAMLNLAAGSAGGSANIIVADPVLFAMLNLDPGAAGGSVDGARLVFFAASFPAGRASGSVLLATDTAIAATRLPSGMADGSLTPDIDGQALIVADVAKAVLEVLSKCGCTLGEVDDCLRGEIMVQINAALQTMFSEAHRLDYFNRQKVTVTVAAGSSEIALDDTIQNILSPVRLKDTKKPLSEITDRSEFDQSVDLYYGGGAAPDVPRFYHLLALNQGHADNVSLTLLVAPAPAADCQIDVDYSAESPRYVWADVMNGTPLSIPQRYAETLLIPLVRDWATSHRWFVRKDLLPQIQQQALLARQMLGMVEPEQPDTVNRKPQPAKA